MPSQKTFPPIAALALAVSLAACAAPATEAASPPPPPPAAHPPAGMTISALPSGSTQSTAAMAFEGG